MISIGKLDPPFRVSLSLAVCVASGSAGGLLVVVVVVVQLLLQVLL